MKNKLKEFARANHVPIIQDEAAEFLQEFCRQNKPKKILEIGTAIGYSGLAMLEAASDAKLTTIEINEERMNMAKEALKQKNVIFVLEDAFSAIKKLEEKGSTFDLIFLDGPKGQYGKYLPHLLKLLNEGGSILCDNISFGGLVFNNEYPKHKHRTHILNMRKFVNEVQEDKRLDVKIVDIADKMMIIKFRQVTSDK